MHYTSIENIHKVIDPLFLDDLKAECDRLVSNASTTDAQFLAFQSKLASLTFLDPACGSGNFLTETYLSLRRLENRVIYARSSQMQMGNVINPIKVSIQQFYGIEIADFAVSVAMTALWIAEHKMFNETEKILVMNMDFLPLKTFTHIHEGDALKADWNEVVPAEKLSYIMGNPPFLGFTYTSDAQRAEMQQLFPGVKNLDYVCGWYKKASEYMEGSTVEAAFVSTNSIVQGETVGRFWNFLPNDIINFAYRSFAWDSEALAKAHVHCVIIGFSKFSRPHKWIFDGDERKEAKNINRYLFDGDDIIVESRNKPLCDVPKMIYGNKPADGGNLIIEDADLNDFIAKDPLSKKFIKPMLGSDEYINNKRRWCLWLDGADPAELKKCPLVLDRIKKCKAAREGSKAAAIRKFALTPALFAQRTQPVDENFIIVPRVSSQTREYIPIGLIKAGTIVNDAVQIIPNGGLYELGILESSVHMGWMRVVAGRLETRYRYSKDVVYNNFPWPSPTGDQKAKIEQAAQAILDARAKYPDSSLADLYDPLTMPIELRKAHNANDKAVMDAYGFDKNMTEPEIVSALMRMYQELVAKV